MPLNRGDDMRSKALMREVRKVDPQVNNVHQWEYNFYLSHQQNDYSILLYSLVNWEQLKGELPPLLMPAENGNFIHFSVGYMF